MRSVLWLGGAPCAGKSSLARLLGERFGLAVVHVDDTVDALLAQLDPVRHPALSGWMALSWDERWARPLEALVDEVVGCYRKHLGFVREQVPPWIGGVLRECVDPAAAFERWMERDARFAAWLADEVRGLGLGCIAVDGSRSVEEVAGVVAGRFWLGGSGEVSE